MTDSDPLVIREPVPTGLKYAIAAGAFAVAGLALEGDVEAAISLSKTLGWALVALSALEILLPLAEAVGDRIGRHWRSEEVSP